MKKIYIGGLKNIFYKSLGNASAGLPISLVLNVLIAIPLVVYLNDIGVHPLLNAGVLAIPFFWASAFRMTLIDYVYEKHNIHIDPKSLCKHLWNNIKLWKNLRIRIYYRLK